MSNLILEKDCYEFGFCKNSTIKHQTFKNLIGTSSHSPSKCVCSLKCWRCRSPRRRQWCWWCQQCWFGAAWSPVGCQCCSAPNITYMNTTTQQCTDQLIQTLRCAAKTEKRLLLLQPTISLSKRQMPAPSAVEKFGALWKWDYWGAPLLPRRTACCCPTAIPILLSSTRVQPCAEDRLVHNREFFASNNKTELFSQCTPHPRPGVIVLICMKKLRK